MAEENGEMINTQQHLLHQASDVRRRLPRNRTTSPREKGAFCKAERVRNIHLSSIAQSLNKLRKLYSSHAIVL